MKKTIISIIVAVVATFSAKAQTTIIDFDYAKETNINMVWFDFDADGELDEDEAYAIKGRLFFDYKDFKDSGNVLDISMRLEGAEGKTETFSARLRDIVLAHYTDNMGAPTFMALNKLKEPQFSFVVSDGSAAILVYNPAIFSE